MSDNITAETLAARYAMDPHIENGTFSERHFAYAGEGRAPSGSIFYYVSPGERTEFHVIDCDEYWCYIKGSPLEVWLLSEKGAAEVKRLGIAEDCEPLIYVKSGTVFASRNREKCGEGTFLSCITVPRFDYAGFRLVPREEMLARFPDTAAFYGI